MSYLPFELTGTWDPDDPWDEELWDSPKQQENFMKQNLTKLNQGSPLAPLVPHHSYLSTLGPVIGHPAQVVRATTWINSQTVPGDTSGGYVSWSALVSTMSIMAPTFILTSALHKKYSGLLQLMTKLNQGSHLQ